MMRRLDGAERLYVNEMVLDPGCLRGHFLPEDKPSVSWTDDNSNFAGSFGSGPLQGWIFFLDHEETMTIPRFRDELSLENWLAKNLNADFFGIPTDYPRLEAASTDSDDLALAELYRKIWVEGGSGPRIAALRSLSLLPVDATSNAIGFLETEDQWVEEACVKLLGKRRVLSAADTLMQVALNGSHNGRLAALVAFRSWGAAGTKYLKELRPLFPSGYEGYFRGAC